MTQLDLYDPADKLAVKFKAYHARNPEIYERFCELAFEAIRRGHRKFGSQAILEVMRWQSEVGGDDGFKINNNYAAYYARLFAHDYREHADFFRVRELRS